MKNRKETSTERNNRTAMIAHFSDVTVMSVFWILQALSKVQPWAFVLIALLLGYAPVIAEYYFFQKTHETKAIKHLCAIGFAVYYTFTLFTATNHQVLLFVLPMLLIISVYGDARYCIMINTGTVLETILLVIIGNTTGRYGYENMYTGIIQIIVMLIIAIDSYYTSRTLNRNMQSRLQRANESREESEKLVQKLSDLSSHVNEEINQIYGSIDQLNEAAKKTQTAMQEVSSGASETANAVQNQSLQTQAIQVKVDQVNTASQEISQNMQRTIEMVSEGNSSMESLVQLVDISVANSEDAAGKLNTLNQYMEKMNSIVELIGDITSQTSLLALNASIEAARAGDAGKGFSVVASEITGMATRTKDATVQIGITAEKESTHNTAKSFSVIQQNSFSIQNSIEELTGNTVDLRNSNQTISDSVQTISAVSEELTAHASETMDAETVNTEILETIAAKMKSLVQYIEKQ